MNGLIRASLNNAYAVTVMALTMIFLGGAALFAIPVDILPVFNSPATQALTFYNGMPAVSVANDITNRMERWTGQANGKKSQESRSIIGASIVRNMFFDGVDPNGALTQVNSLALSTLPYLPPGTLPPVVLPYDPTSSTPVCVVAMRNTDSSRSADEVESLLYDVGRYEVRNYIMGIRGANAPIVYGGKVRAVMVYLDRYKMQARRLSPIDVMNALDDYNVFLPAGDAKFGETDYVLESNSMYIDVKDMGDIPLRTEPGNSAFIKDVGEAEDSNFIQTNIVRVDGQKQVYIPVYRQLGASTLSVVRALKGSIKEIETKLTRGGIKLDVVLDQSVYVTASISALAQEGILGAVLCSLTILMFLGEWKMTAIAIMTLPLSVLSACVCLYASGNTINVMTLAGLTLAIGPMVDSAIICLENTERHLKMGAVPVEAAFLGASEVALPELVSTICTFLVLAPLTLVPGLGTFLFKPMALAVAFAMISAYILSRTLVPTCSAAWLKGHDEGHAAGENGQGDHVEGDGHVQVVSKGRPAVGHGHDPHSDGENVALANDHPGLRSKNPIIRAYAKWQVMIDKGIAAYVRGLDVVLRNRILAIGIAVGWLILMLVVLTPLLRKEFFPEVDSGSFEMYVRGPSGRRIELTNDRMAAVEKVVRKAIPKEDLQLIIAELGVVADWSAAYTPNAGPMDAVVKIQLTPERKLSAQDYVAKLRRTFQQDSRFSDLEFAFDAGGMVRAAMNEGKSTPINIRVTGKNQKSAHAVATALKQQVQKINGVVDARVIQRLNYPEYTIKIDRAKAAILGLTQVDVMRTVVAASNSSIQFNKHNFWIDSKSHNQYFVGVQYREKDIVSMETLLNIPITSPKQGLPVPLSTIMTYTKGTVPTEITHYDLQPTIDLTMGVEGRDLGHVADDVSKVIDNFGERQKDGRWDPYDPTKPGKKVKLPGSKIIISGEYQRMQDVFKSIGVGLAGAALLMYFLMVGLDKSWLVPFSVMFVVPISLGGVFPMLYLTGTALNVQSLLGIIFVVGIKVANTVLMTDYAQEIRRHEGLSPFDAIRKAASVRVRPVTMTALAAFFAMIPGALALERGSEANAPLARAILGGLLAGEPATLFILPALYSLIIKDPPGGPVREAPHGPETEPDPHPDAGWV